MAMGMGWGMVLGKVSDKELGKELV